MSPSSTGVGLPASTRSSARERLSRTRALRRTARHLQTPQRVGQGAAAASEAAGWEFMQVRDFTFDFTHLCPPRGALPGMPAQPLP